VVVAGGLTASGAATSSVDMFNLNQRVWSVGPRLPVALNGATALTDVADNALIVAGGQSSSVFRLAGPNQQWEEVSNLRADTDQRQFASVLAVNDASLPGCAQDV
jgi:hypothetical protein